MLPSAIRDQLLVDEAQLGQRLNRDLQHGDRADFRLHLALLAASVEEQPWFDDQPAVTTDNRNWRAHFGLPASTGLVAPGAGADCSALNERLQQGGTMADVRLWLALAEQPLVAQWPRLDPEVYDNLPLLTRARLKGQWSDVAREDDPAVMLPLLNQLQQGIDTRLHWRC